MEESIHDCYVSVTGMKPSSKQIENIKTNLPSEILLLGKQWGWDDTEVNDKIFVRIKNNLTDIRES